MRRLLGQRDLEGAILGGDSRRVVPLEVARLPIVEVGSFPVRIVAGIEGSSVVVEFVRENQLQLRPVVEGGPCQCPIWSIWVDGTPAAWKLGNLEY